MLKPGGSRRVLLVTLDTLITRYNNKLKYQGFASSGLHWQLRESNHLRRKEMDKKKNQNNDKELEDEATAIKLNITLLERKKICQEMQLEIGEEESRHAMSSNEGEYWQPNTFPDAKLVCVIEMHKGFN